MNSTTEDPKFLNHIEQITKRDPRYASKAHVFIQEAVSLTSRRIEVEEDRQNQHISSDELLHGVCELAQEFYGPLAVEVFRAWGIQTAADIGNIVFLQAEEGLLGVSDEDSPTDFVDSANLIELLLRPYAENEDYTKNYVPIE